MSDLTLADLDARLARVEAQLGITPAPTPAAKPAKPTGLSCVIGQDGRPQLTWDAASDATAWEVQDELNLTKPVQATVTEPESVRSALKPGQQRRYAVLAIGPGGRSEMSDSIDVPPAGETPAPVPAPSTSAVDLSRWKLTIPEASAGKVVEIKPPALATYTSRYLERLDDGSLRFRCWHGGATTSGSANPRSELRERVGDDPEGYWDASKGRHVMEWAGQVNRLTKVRPHVVLGQSHDEKNDVVVLRLEADKLWLTNGNDTHAHLVDDKFTLGRPYACRFEVTNGDYAFFYNGNRVDYTLRSTAKAYFKCGLYAQTNPKSAPDESTDEYDEVIVYALSTTHTA